MDYLQKNKRVIYCNCSEGGNCPVCHPEDWDIIETDRYILYKMKKKERKYKCNSCGHEFTGRYRKEDHVPCCKCGAFIPGPMKK